MLITLVAASVVSAAPAATSRPGGTAARSDLQRRVQTTRLAKDDGNGALAQFLSGPACEVPTHDSGNHFGWVKQHQNGLIGGSYGELFFASGAGTRSVNSAAGSNAGATADTSTAATGTTSGPGNSGSAGAGASAQNGTATSAAATSAATAADTNAAAAAVVATTPANARALAGGPLAINVGQAAVNPEPATLLLLGTGLGAVLLNERRRRSKK